MASSWASLCGAAAAQQPSVYAGAPVEIHIPAQPLPDALKTLADQTGLQFAYEGNIDSRLMAPPISGVYSPEVALARMLAPSGLTHHFINQRTVAIEAKPDTGNANSKSEDQPEQPGSSGRHIAAAGGASAYDVPPPVSTASSLADQRESDNRVKGLEEVLVTAQKRAEKLLDVPASISAITGDRLDALHVNSLSDLASYVPGLSVSDGGVPGSRLISIRGLSTDYYPTAGPLVGTYIDDLPVGDSTNTARGALYGLDLNPYDVERVEVLKGPQGTLYGANTMGGLIKYSLRKPDLERFGVQAGTEGAYLHQAGGANYGVRGAVNLPLLVDKLAVRLSGFDKHNAGYIDNVITGAKAVNHSTETGGRGDILWRLTDGLELRASVLAQNVDAANVTAVTLDGATLQLLYGRNKLASYFAEPGTQYSRVYSASLDWDLKFATLTNSAGWSHVKSNQTNDFTSGFGPYVPDHPDALVPLFLSLETNKFVDEIRLTSPDRQLIKWQIGGFFTRENSYSIQNLPAFTPTYTPLPDELLFFENSSGTYKETAGFANLTYTLNEYFDASGGIRYSSYEQTFCPDVQLGVFGAPFAPCTSLPSTGVTQWMVNARFHVNDGGLLYARVATGYRPGQGCPSCGNEALGIPGIVNADKTVNYEAGYKASLLAQRLQLELAAFHIDWRHIQVNQLTDQGLLFAANAGTAVSNGFEATVGFEVLSGLRLNSTVAYTDAHLTQDIVNGNPFGAKGDQLPGSPRWTGSLAADFTHEFTVNASYLVGMGYRYKDAIVNQFAHSSFSAPIGPQNIADAYIGLAIQDLTVRLYGTNIFDNRSYVGALYLQDTARPAFVPIQPRTVGLSLEYRFQK